MQKLNFIDDMEIELAKIQHESDDEAKQITITNKRIYVNVETAEIVTDSIINLDKVEYVSIETKEVKQSHAAVPMLGALLLFMGVIFLIMHSMAEVLLILGIVSGIIGVIILIVGAAINRPKYSCKFVIGTSGIPIEIIADDFAPKELNEIQKQIFIIIETNNNAHIKNNT